MNLTFTFILVFCCLPYWVQSQITRQEIDKKDNNKTIVYKVEGSSDLDILNQLNDDVAIGQEIQIAWEKPQQQPKPEKVKPIEQKKVKPPSQTIQLPAQPTTTSATTKSPKVVAMSSKKRRKKKSFKVFSKVPKKQKRKKQNRKKCYKF